MDETPDLPLYLSVYGPGFNGLVFPWEGEFFSPFGHGFSGDLPLSPGIQ
jgi:hypothetical protein